MRVHHWGGGGWGEGVGRWVGGSRQEGAKGGWGGRELSHSIKRRMKTIKKGQRYVITIALGLKQKMSATY